LKDYLRFSKVHVQRKFIGLGFVEPATALVVSFCFLGVMIYKRVNLGITLNATAMLLALLSLDWQEIPTIIYGNTVDLLTISVVLATFGVMLLSQLYKETRVINDLSESLGRIIKNSKVVSSVLPAVIGFLPVAGGALMSAPLVDSEAEKLGLKPEKKAYVNLWFRHTIFPVYPVSQILIITAALTGIAIPSIIIRQIPVVIIMITAGYFIGFWKASNAKNKENSNPKNSLNSNLKSFLIAFSPILTTIVVVVGLDLAGFSSSKHVFGVLTATFIGLIVLIAISKPSLQVFARPLKSWGIYGITFAAYGAFLLRNVTVAAGISEIFKTLVTGGTIDVILLLIAVPAVFGFITGSPSGGVAISVSILAAILTFSPKNVALLYMSAYLGYLIAPTHLCLTFTVDYFKCSIGKLYKYLIPSMTVSFATAILLYILV
jgi:integral membrane protein (TIGR00529 family)